MRRRTLLAVSLSAFLVISCVTAARAGWTVDGAPVCTFMGDQTNPGILSDGEGGAFIVWDDSRTWTDIYAQRVDDMGRPLWAENGIVVSNAFMSQARVMITSDGAGGFIAAWIDSREETHFDIYAQRVGPDGSMLWTENGVAVCTAADDQDRPMICGDGAGGCIIAWVDERTSYVADDIYAQRLDSDGNPLWTADGVVVCTADSLQEEMRIVSDGSGGAIVVWADCRVARDIYAQRLDPAGSPLWAADGIPVCNEPVPQYDFEIATDGAGGVFVTWLDSQGSSFDIRVQRIDSSGETVFVSTGRLICDAIGTQRQPAIAPDGYGGAIIAWEDFRNGSGNSDVYAQRVAADGSLVWYNDNGMLINSRENEVFDIAVMQGSGGGAILAWSDCRDQATLAWDIYAQRVDGNGQGMWTVDGDSICRATGSQSGVVLAGDGGGGAIMAWRDGRNPDFDIYAQRITYNGDFVGTSLSSYSCSPEGEGILLEWRVSEPREPSDFTVARRGPGGDGYTDMAGEPETIDGSGFAFTDLSAEPGTEYGYRVYIVDGGERRELFETGPVALPAAPLTLHQNVPNPFNPSTDICWYLDIRSTVKLEVFDPAGRRIATLADGILEAGDHSARWDGTGRNGNPVVSGVYLYRLTAGKRTLTKKMVLLR